MSLSQRRQVAKDTGIIVAVTLISKVTGLVRTVVQATVYGASVFNDSFVAATVYPNIVFAGINNAITTTLIPLYTEIRERDGREAAFRYANVVETTLLLGLLAVLGLGYAAASWLMPLYLPGWVHKVADGWNLITLTVDLTWVMLPSLIFLGLAGVQTALLQAEGEFGVPAALGIPQNIILVLAMLLLASRLNIFAAAVGTVLAGVAMLVVQSWPLRRIGYRFHPEWNFQHPELRRMGRMVVPVFLATFVGQAGYIVDRILASGLRTGSMSALNYASLVNNVVLGLFVTALVTVLYPTLSRYTARRDAAGFVQAVRRSLGMLTVATMPMTVGVVILAVPIIRVVYQRGAFTSSATHETAFALAFFAVGLVGNAAAILLPRAFFALKDTRTPTAFGIAAVAVNIAADLALVHPLRLGGLALGTSLAQWALTGVLLWRLRRRVGPIGGGRLAATAMKAFAASAIMGALVYGLYHEAAGRLPVGHATWSALLLLALAVVGLAVYALMAWLFRIDEFSYLIGLVRDAWARRPGSARG